MKKVLILKSDFDDYERFYIKHMNNEFVHTEGYIRPLNYLLKSLAIIWTKYLCMPFSEFWYGSWKYHLKQFSCVILFDRILGWPIVDYIKKNNPNCRIIIWYWNTGKPKIPEKYKSYCEGWSFDPGDCEKNNYNYNTQFSFRGLNQCSVPIKRDCFFVGLDKGRFQTLYNMKRIFEQYHITSKLSVVRDKFSKAPLKFYSSAMSYEQVVLEVRQSRCIIDVTKEGQKGETLRVLESLMLKKKLITTDINIIEKPYYNHNNIFIWGKDDIKALKKFLHSPYDDIDDSIIEKYTFEKWIENFNI